MYRLIFKCRRKGKLDYLFIAPIITSKKVLCSLGITYNKYRSYNFNTLYEARGILNYVIKNKQKIVEIVRSFDEEIENIIGYEIEEDYGTQHIIRLIEVGKIK